MSSLVPTRDDVLGFILLCRRLADACRRAETCFLKGFTDPWIDHPSPLASVLDAPLDPAYRIQLDELRAVVNRLYDELAEMMEHPDFVTPSGWKKLDVYVARLRDSGKGVFRYTPEMFVVKHPVDGRDAYHTSRARDRFASLGERIDELVRGCHMERSMPEEFGDVPQWSGAALADQSPNLEHPVTSPQEPARFLARTEVLKELRDGIWEWAGAIEDYLIGRPLAGGASPIWLMVAHQKLRRRFLHWRNAGIDGVSKLERRAIKRAATLLIPSTTPKGSPMGDGDYFVYYGGTVLATPEILETLMLILEELGPDESEGLPTMPSAAPPAALPAPLDCPEADAPPSSESNFIDYDHIAEQLRKGRKATQAALVEYMADRGEAKVDDIARHVHGHDASDKALRANVARTNDSLAELGSTLRFRMASGRVYREPSRK